MSAKQNSNITIKEIIDSSKATITKIFLLQTALLAITTISLVFLNLTPPVILSKNMIVILNSSLFGFMGSLVYFSRKSYVYLITNKIKKIAEDNNNNNNFDIASILSIIRGYYLYLFFRPFVGLIIGPIFYLFSMTGLFTFLKKTGEIENELSRSGRYFIYIISFLAGHISSDVLDRFSKIARKVIDKQKYLIDEK